LAAGVGSPDNKGYAADVLAREQRRLRGLVLENLSCSGATTGSMINGPGCSYTTGTQLGDAEAFLAAHRGQVAFVTIDIGGNDVDGCTNGTTINAPCVTAGMNAITAHLPVILSGLASAGGSVPVVGMSYYDPFLAAWLLGPGGHSLAHQSVTLLNSLNGLLGSDYGAGNTADVSGAFASTDFSPGGHYGGTGVPVNVGRICRWTLMCSQANIHANDLGHAHIARAFEKVLGPRLP
jgi:lysophospholipase L1-like esterase